MSRALLGTLVLAIFLSGCTHALEVKNRNDFYVTPVDINSSLTIGVTSENTPGDGRRLVDATAEALRTRIDKVIYPYTSSAKVNLLVTMKVTSNHKGSGLNFLINWPGFLIWTPAWNGYVYKPSYNVRVEFKDLAGNAVLDTFDVPIELDVRHADFNRTWTEISWLEVSLIAFVGGIVFTDYDHAVTPLVEKDMRQELGSFLAEKILQHLALLNAQPPAT